jgi:glycosyltransferase involved in cell wall biosynthesis
MGPPRTSVLMPAFNAEETLQESVESVLAQRLGDFELIVIDDASDTPVTDVFARNP